MKCLFRTVLMLAVITTAFTATSVSAGECGKVTIANMTWGSASLMAHIDNFILKHGYGCETELVPGNTVITTTSMVEKGVPDIASEVWTTNVKEILERGIAEKKIRYAGSSLPDGGEQGLYIPKYMVDENPELATISGIKKNAELFTTREQGNKPTLLNCPPGWACQITTANLFNALKLEDYGFVLADSGSAAGQQGAVAKAFERHEAWLGYYWTPTPLLGKYEMVLVDLEVPADNEHFYNCLSKPDCENPRVSPWPVANVQTVITESFAAESPVALTYFNNRHFTSPMLSELLAWKEENQADGETGAEHFITEYERVWTQWVPADVAVKIKNALSE